MVVNFEKYCQVKNAPIHKMKSTDSLDSKSRNVLDKYPIWRRSCVGRVQGNKIHLAIYPNALSRSGVNGSTLAQ